MNYIALPFEIINHIFYFTPFLTNHDRKEETKLIITPELCYFILKNFTIHINIVKSSRSICNYIFNHIQPFDEDNMFKIFIAMDDNILKNILENCKIFTNSFRKKIFDINFNGIGYSNTILEKILLNKQQLIVCINEINEIDVDIKLSLIDFIINKQIIISNNELIFILMDSYINRVQSLKFLRKILTHDNRDGHEIKMIMLYLLSNRYYNDNCVRKFIIKYNLEKFVKFVIDNEVYYENSTSGIISDCINDICENNKTIIQALFINKQIVNYLPIPFIILCLKLEIVLLLDIKPNLIKYLYDNHNSIDKPNILRLLPITHDQYEIFLNEFECESVNGLILIDKFNSYIVYNKNHLNEFFTQKLAESINIIKLIHYNKKLDDPELLKCYIYLDILYINCDNNYNLFKPIINSKNSDKKIIEYIMSKFNKI
jgi:hypothetical protein